MKVRKPRRGAGFSPAPSEAFDEMPGLRRRRNRRKSGGRRLPSTETLRPAYILALARNGCASAEITGASREYTSPKNEMRLVASTSVVQ